MPKTKKDKERERERQFFLSSPSDSYFGHITGIQACYIKGLPESLQNKHYQLL